MNKVEQNRKAWNLLSKDHYEYFRNKFKEDSYKLNPIVSKELGEISGKKILHLQCNTGADTIMLAKMGADVTGVDFAPDNIHYAKKLAEELNVNNIDFIESDIMKLMEKHEGKYDIVLTSDGAIGWLPDLDKWGNTISYFLKDNGFFYMHDLHPFFLSFDEDLIDDGVLEAKYPYFGKEPDEADEIGGYASDSKEAKNYFWMYTIGSIINSLSRAGLFIEYLNEYDRCDSGMGGIEIDEEGLSYYPALENKLPIVFSLKAVLR